MKTSVAAGILVAALLVAAPLPVLACVAFAEDHTNSSTASVRTRPPVAEACDISEDSYRQAIKAWLQTRSPGAALTGLSLARAVQFRWISQHLADAGLKSAEWRRRVARGSSGLQNSFVAAALSEPAFLNRLAAPFEGTGYVVRGVSVEKVLVGPAGKYSSTDATSTAVVPFDAQVWLRLEPR